MAMTSWDLRHISRSLPNGVDGYQSTMGSLSTRRESSSSAAVIGLSVSRPHAALHEYFVETGADRFHVRSRFPTLVPHVGQLKRGRTEPALRSTAACQ